jgi:hypothetical protein
LAVIVTVCDWVGPSVVANDQLQVPEALVPDFVTVPTEALKVTVSPAFASDQVPVFAADCPSLTVTVALARATAGAALAAVTVTLGWDEIVNVAPVQSVSLARAVAVHC